MQGFKRICLTAVLHEGKFTIGAVREGMRGYHPMLHYFGEFKTYDEAVIFANEYNKEKLEIEPKEAYDMVLESMRTR